MINGGQSYYPHNYCPLLGVAYVLEAVIHAATSPFDLSLLSLSLKSAEVFAIVASEPGCSAMQFVLRLSSRRRTWNVVHRCTGVRILALL